MKVRRALRDYVVITRNVGGIIGSDDAACMGIGWGFRVVPVPDFAANGPQTRELHGDFI